MDSGGFGSVCLSCEDSLGVVVERFREEDAARLVFLPFRFRASTAMFVLYCSYGSNQVRLIPALPLQVN